MQPTNNQTKYLNYNFSLIISIYLSIYHKHITEMFCENSPFSWCPAFHDHTLTLAFMLLLQSLHF